MKNNSSTSWLLALTLLAAAAATSHAQVITAWTFENDTAATNDTPAPSTGTGSADAIGMTNSYNSTTSTNTDDVLLGTTGDTGVNGNADLTNEWRVRGKSPGNGWSSQAAIGTQGAQFKASTAGYTSGNIQVKFDFYVTNQAESNMQFEYTTDGVHYQNLALSLAGSDSGLALEQGSASDTNTVNGSYVSVQGGGQDWFTGLTATITDPAALNDANFGIEMVNASTGADVLGASGGAYNNNSGNWRFDNISIADVPEPSTWALLGLALSGLTCMARLRNLTRRA